MQTKAYTQTYFLVLFIIVKKKKLSNVYCDYAKHTQTTCHICPLPFLFFKFYLHLQLLDRNPCLIFLIDP